MKDKWHVAVPCFYLAHKMSLFCKSIQHNEPLIYTRPAYIKDQQRSLLTTNAQLQEIALRLVMVLPASVNISIRWSLVQLLVYSGANAYPKFLVTVLRNYFIYHQTNTSICASILSHNTAK